MTAVNTLESRYREVMDRARAAAERAGRPASGVLVVAVTKYAEMDDIRRLMELGHQDFGESRVQQLVQRAAVADEMVDRHRTMERVAAAHRAKLGPDARDAPTGQPPEGGALPPVRWHMIGHLQRNKVARALPHLRLVHSVDSLRLVEEMQSWAMKRDADVDVLVQVNTSGEDSKYGCAVAAAPHLCEQIDLTGNLHVRGLMTIAPYSENPEDARPFFARLREVFSDIRRRGIGEQRFNILSMGMSGDFEVAIEEGANLVRVGSALFPADNGEQDGQGPHNDDDS